MSPKFSTAIKLGQFFVLALITAFTLASVFHTTTVLKRLVDLGVSIPFETWLESFVTDWIGLAPGYGSVIGISLALGFILMEPIRRILTLPLPILYAVSGLTSMTVMLLAMQPLLDITLIAGARGTVGFILQILSGAIGGLLFGYWIARSR